MLACCESETELEEEAKAMKNYVHIPEIDLNSF